jgi:hypothetical protein
MSVKRLAARIACAWARRALGDRPAVRLAGSRSRWLETHLQRCAGCADFASELERLEAELQLLGRGSRPIPPLALRARLLAAYELETSGGAAGAVGLARIRWGVLGRLTWWSGAVAAGALLGVLAWSRLDALVPPPRSVRIQVPPGYRALAEPVVVVRRGATVEVRR